MRPPALPDLQNIKTFDQLKNFVTQNVKAFYAILNKGSLFLDQMNVAYKTGVVLTSGTTTKVTHNLGTPPIGYIVIYQVGAATVSPGGGIPWTDKEMYLTANATTTVNLLILKG